MEQYRINLNIERYEREYKNFTEAFIRMMSYRSKLRKVSDELSHEDKERISKVESMLDKRLRRIYRRMEK